MGRDCFAINRTTHEIHDTSQRSTLIMKAELYKNIDLVRIPIKQGISEYFLPQNVDWAKEYIHKIVVCAPEIPCIDPVDGTTPVLKRSDIQDLYFNLYSETDKELWHDLSFEQILHTNNNPIEVNSKLDLALCRFYFNTTPSQDATLLLYVYHDTNVNDNYDLPTQSVTATFPLAAEEELSLQAIINTYVHALPSKIKGFIFWDAVGSPAYITLRDYNLTYTLQHIHSELARPDRKDFTPRAQDLQARLLLLDDIDINFEYSSIRNATANKQTQTITFLY